MQANQETFSKVINPLTDKARGTEKFSSSPSPQEQFNKQDNRPKKQKADFENFLR